MTENIAKAIDTAIVISIPIPHCYDGDRRCYYGKAYETIKYGLRYFNCGSCGAIFDSCLSLTIGYRGYTFEVDPTD